MKSQKRLSQWLFTWKSTQPFLYDFIYANKSVLSFRTSETLISFIFLATVQNGLRDCVNQFQLLLCGAIQLFNISRHIFGVELCDASVK